MTQILALALLVAPSAFADDLPGKASYDTYCSTCHGTAGGGDGVAGAALTPKPANFTDPAFWAREDINDEHLTKVIKEGGASVGKSPMMAPWGGVLSDEQVAEVIAYVKTFKPAE